MKSYCLRTLTNYRPVKEEPLKLTIKLTISRTKNLAGAEGLEPAHAGIKIRCLNQLGDAPTRVAECIESTLSTTENSINYS